MLPIYRFSMSLGVVPDVVCEGDSYNEHFAEWVDARLASWLYGNHVSWKGKVAPAPVQPPGVNALPGVTPFSTGNVDILNASFPPSSYIVHIGRIFVPLHT